MTCSDTFIQIGFTNSPNHRVFYDVITQQLVGQSLNIRSLERFALNQVTSCSSDVQTVGNPQFTRRRSHAFTGAIRLPLARMNVNLPKHRGPVSFSPPLPVSKANSRYRLVPMTPEDCQSSDPACPGRRARAGDST